MKRRGFLSRIWDRRPSVYERILRASEENRGLNLTPKEVAVLAKDILAGSENYSVSNTDCPRIQEK